MKFSLIPVSLAVVVSFSTVQAFAGETQASTSASFGGEGMNSSQQGSNAAMQNNTGPAGLDQNLWGRYGQAAWGGNVDNGNNNNNNGNQIPPTQVPHSGGSGASFSSNPVMQVQSYQWQQSKYKPYSYDPPAQYRSSQARTTSAHPANKKSNAAKAGKTK